MKHCGTQRIETERLILRRFVLEDAGAMFRNWASDSEVTKFLTWPTHRSAEVSERVLKESGDEPVGNIAAVQVNDDIASVHIGYCIGRAFWHQGIMSEALQAVIDFFFDTVGVNRVESRHDPENPHSGMVMQKCGMQYEGTLRRSDRNNQGICDACWYSILRSEWEGKTQ